MPGSAGFQLLRRPLGWDLTPADVLRLVRDDAHPVALFGDWAGGGDVVAAEPVLVRAAPEALGDVLDRPFPPGADGDGDGDPGPEAAAFGGGWIGYLGYNAGGEALPATGPRALPAWWFGYYDHVLRRDRATGEWAFEALWTPGRAAALDARLAELTSRAAPSSGLAYRFSAFRLVPSPARHQAAVGAAVDYVRQGDIFQANITLRAEAELTGDPLDAFCQAASTLQPPYAAFVGVSAAPDGRRGPAARAAVASLSPELFLRRSGDVVASKPIKGTARRAADAREAHAQRAGLEASVKDRAENVMIVDLVRNDLSRVCVPGSVTVPVLLGPEPHPGVWHLVSTVTGTLNPGAGDGDLVRATFPPGSVTGAPKVRALEVIDELETAPREVYTGAIGYRSPAAGLELNVAIRTFEFAAGRAWLGAGGGIVADSDPAAEYAECLIKATPLLTAVGARLDPDLPARGDGGEAGRETAADGLAAVLPRPAAGVFTSLLVTAGETRGLAAHLARLAGSVRDLYGKELPASLPDALAGVLAGQPTGRLRVTVRPLGGPLQATVEVVPLGPRPSSVTLCPVTVPGGIGPHKYRDRRLLTDLAAREQLAPDEQLLVTDETGELLETDRACLFAVIDGVLLTPPADGRLLPGTTRAAALRAAHALGVRVGQKPLTLDELAAATEVFVINAVAGVLPVTAIRPGRRIPSVTAARLDNPVPSVTAARLDNPVPSVTVAPPDNPVPSVTAAPPGTVVAASAPRWAPGPVTAAIAAALDARPPDEPFTPAALAAPSPQGAARRAITFPVASGRARPAIVMIDNYDSFTWNLAHLLDTAGARVEVVRNDEVTAAEVIAAAPAGVVISPGPCAPAEAGISIAAVAACAAAGVPLLGICLGHQAIGAAFGASIIAAPRPVHGQAFPVQHDGTGVLRGLPDPFQATRYHSLIVDEATLPASLLVTARTDGLPMALRHRTLPIEGVQFHPESILTTHGAAIMAAFVTATAKPR